jgi:hypothetical protein
VDEHGDLPTPFHQDNRERLGAASLTSDSRSGAGEKGVPQPWGALAPETLDPGTSEQLHAELAKHQRTTERHDEGAGPAPLPALPPTYNPRWALQREGAGSPEPGPSSDSATDTNSSLPPPRVKR